MSISANWSYPTLIKMGAGRIKELADHCKSLGMKKPLLITDRGLAPMPITQNALDILEAGGLGRAIFADVDPNPNEKNLAAGAPNRWHCRAGARYLYVCEDGLVHWCSQQRGHPGIPLDEYGEDHLHMEYHRDKQCAPFCTVGCVHRVAQVDELRDDPEGALAAWCAAPGASQPARLPGSVRLLRWAFVTNPRRELFRSAAAALLRGGR